MNINSVASINRTDCTGCGLCAEKCPKMCISMQPDIEGFLMPSIDESVCVNCGICLKNCTATDVADNLEYEEERKYFCSIISDKKMLIKSSSGGMFGILAEYFIQNNGYVCGCVYNEKTEAIHIVTNSTEDVLRMYGSKYVQSRAYPCFERIKELVVSGAPVMFVGTACQVAALRIFIA